MKRVFTLVVFAALSLAAAAQSSDPYNFKIEDGGLVWQKVFTAKDTCTVEVIVQSLLQRGYVKEIDLINDNISCEFGGLRPEFRSLGYTHGELQIYLTNNVFSGHVTIQVKPNRYRVTLSRIKCYSRHYGTSSLESFAIDSGRFNVKFTEKPAHILDANFTAMFQGLSDAAFADEW